MNRNKKIKLLIAGIAVLAVILIVLTVVMVSKKSKKDDTGDTTKNTNELSTEEEATASDTTEEQEPVRDGMVISDLTGEWIDESLENNRPVCIMINNIIDAIPQSGIGSADIIFEMKVEGSLTRLLCVFKDYDDITKLGPVRSARHYYVEVTDMLDGIYAHFGWSPLAEETIPALGVNNLNGLTMGDNVYYRDSARYAPHNVYTTGSMLNTGIDIMGYSREYVKNRDKMFAFNYEDKKLENGKSANTIKTEYAHNKPWFEYDEAKGVYNRFQYDRAHVDDQTGEQLTFKNVIVMLVQYTSLDGVDHQDVDWEKGGKAYYATNGEYEEITWKKENSVIKFFDKDGNQLHMNPGKTFVAVFDEANPDGVSFE